MGLDTPPMEEAAEGSDMKQFGFILIFVYLCLYILPLGVRPLVIPDEARYAEIAREMAVTGDFVSPHLNGLRYFEKPVMGHWLNAASIMVFGENEFAVRFPSALAAGLSALMLFFLARRFSAKKIDAKYIDSGNFAGEAAVLIFLTCFFVFAVGVYSVLDSMFSFFITAAMICYFYAFFQSNQAGCVGRDSFPTNGREASLTGYGSAAGRRNTFLLCFGIFVGFAFLTKGFLAFAIPVIVIGPFLVWERRWKELFLSPWIPLTAAVLVILPWAVWIHLKEPDFWNYFFWEEHIRRFAADDAQHKAPFYYFLLYFPVAALPWTFMLPTAVSGLRKRTPNAPLDASLIRYAICWLVFPFLFFSTAKGKLLTYILPCFVPFALLVAMGLLNYITSKSDVDTGIKNTRCFSAGAMLAACFFAGLALVLTIMQMTDVFHFKPFILEWKYWVAVSGIMACAVLILIAVQTTDGRRKILIYGLAPTLFMFSAHFLYPDAIVFKKSPGTFLMKHADKIFPATVIVSDYSPIHAVCWYYKRQDVYLLGNSGELTYGVRQQDAAFRLLTVETLQRLINENPRNLVLVARKNNYQKWKTALPMPVFEDNNGQFVFTAY